VRRAHAANALSSVSLSLGYCQLSPPWPTAELELGVVQVGEAEETGIGALGNICAEVHWCSRSTSPAKGIGTPTV
jgi:hypothetical protein